MKRLWTFALAGLLLAEPSFGDVVVWDYPTGDLVNGVETAPDGGVLFGHKIVGTVVVVSPVFPTGGTTVWQMSGFNQPDHARFLPNGNVLVADTVNNRVVEVNAAGGTVWSFGQGPGLCNNVDLAFPGDGLRLPNGDTLIADQYNRRVLRVSAAGNVLWQYGAANCSGGSGPNQLWAPFAAESLANGDFLITDTVANFVIRVTPTGTTGGPIVWQYGGTPAGSGVGQLNFPTRANALQNGNVLIADAHNHRVIEVEPAGSSGGPIVWQYGVTGDAGVASGYLSSPYEAQRLPNGSTLIADPGNNRLIEVAPATLKFTSAPQTVGVGACSAPVTLELLGSTGPVVVADPVSVTLQVSTPSATAFSDTCVSPAQDVTIPVGGSSATFYFQSSQRGTVGLTASAVGVGSAQQIETVIILSDAGSATDAGPPDGGGGPTPDLRLHFGCGCSTSSGGDLAGLALLILVRRRRPAGPR